ncbi:MAG TPA: hypothetical protein VIN63_08740 [Candidatus Limnocylindria bacterium]|jgi:hypothetical protein
MAIEDRLEELFMNDSNNRCVTSVNMPQRPNPWHGVAAFAGVAAIAGIALVAVILGLRSGQQAASPTATATATVIPSATSSSPVKSSPPTAGPTYQSQLGYSVLLPSGWRRSDLQSYTTPRDDPNSLALETFTTRTPADEAEAMTHSDTGIGPAQMYTAFVGLYRNGRNETAMAYAERMKAGSGPVAVSIEPTTVDGRAGVKTTFKFTPSDAQSFYTLYVQDGDRMWVIGYTLGSPIPPGATEPSVRGIVDSFRFR